MLTLRSKLFCSSFASFLKSSRSISNEKLQSAFLQASKVSSSLDNAGNEDKLMLYALFKQATQGPNKTPKPRAFDMIGSYKWKSWTSLGTISQDEAKQKYVVLVSKLSGKPIESAADSPSSSSSQPSSSAPPAATSEAPPVRSAPAPSSPPTPTPTPTATGSQARGHLATSENLKLTVDESGLATLTINRPVKKNALTLEMYEEWGKLNGQIALDERIRVLAITGAGDYFTSGNDLSNLTRFYSTDPAQIQVNIKRVRQLISTFLHSVATFPKPLVALVNGPAVGIGLTVLAHCDLVLAARGAPFYSPFTALGITPEAGSSFLFPLLIGRARASRLLLLGEHVNSEQLYEWGFVSHLLPPAPEFEAAARRLLDEQLLSLPPTALRLGRQLLHSHHGAALERAIEYELDVLEKCWVAPETLEMAAKFLSRKQPKS